MEGNKQGKVKVTRTAMKQARPNGICYLEGIGSAQSPAAIHALDGFEVDAFSTHLIDSPMKIQNTSRFARRYFIADAIDEKSADPLGLQRRVRSPLNVIYRGNRGGMSASVHSAPKLAGCHTNPVQLAIKP